MPLLVTKTQILFVASLFLFVAPSSLGQSAPMDRAEILGRLAISYSPSYVAYLVRTRGINFSPSPQYIESVKLAGGDGILTDRLDSATSVASTNDQNDLVHLAKCAEFLHSGDVDSADLECRASIDESPQSAWPLVATARVLSLDLLSRIPIQAAKQKTAERIALLEKASSLGPDLAVLQRSTGTAHGVSGPSPEEQRSRALDAQEVETANDRDPYGFRLADQLNGSNEEVSDSQSRPSGQVVVRPETLRFAQDYSDLASAHMMLAVEYARARCFDQAQSEMGEALRLEPDNSAIHSALAAVLLSRHKSDAAIEELREAVRITPFGDSQHIILAGALDASGRTADAVDELQSIIAIHPADAKTSDALVELCLKHKGREAAIKELRRYLKASSVAFTDESEFVDSHFDCENRLAQLLMENQQYAAATEQYLYLLRFKPENAGIHNDYGNVLLAQHNCDAAVDEYNESLRLSPDAFAAHNNIGICLARNGKIDAAIVEFRKSVELDPNEPRSEILLATALGQKGDLKGAKELLIQATERNPKDPVGHLSLAFVLGQLKDEAGAITELKAALKLEPDSPSAENNLAWLYCTAEDRKLRNPTEALVLARRAVDTSPSANPAFLDTLAEAQFLNGRRAEALDTETKAINLDPTKPEFQSRLARFREATNSAASSKP